MSAEIDYHYGWEKLFSAVRCLTGEGNRKRRLSEALFAMDRTWIMENPENHLPKEIRDDYVNFVREIMSKVDELDDVQLSEAENKILHFFEIVCWYHKSGFIED